MQEYKDFRPTPHDGHINIDRDLEEGDTRENWLVLPVGQNRDSETLSRANFQSALEILGGEGDKVEVHRFGHWGPGWFEIILIHPDLQKQGEEIEAALENHPVLDDDLFAEMEHEEEYEDWELWACQDYIRELEEVFDLKEATVNLLSHHTDELFSLHCDYRRETGDFDFRYVSSNEEFSRDLLAKFIWGLRPWFRWGNS